MWSGQVQICLYSLFGVHVHVAHEPAGVVRPDRNGHQVERTASRADLAERGVIRRVADEQGTPSFDVEPEAAPQRLVPIPYASAAEVARRSRSDAQLVDLSVLPPVQLDDLSRTPTSNARTDTNGHHPGCPGASLSDLLGGGPVQVIVMIVREDDGIDRRKSVDRQGGIHDASRPNPLHWGRALTEDRVGQHIETRELQEHGGVADPGRRELRIARSWVRDRRARGRKRASRRRRRAPLATTFLHPPDHVPQPARFAARPGIAKRAVGQAVGVREGGFAQRSVR